MIKLLIGCFTFTMIFMLTACGEDNPTTADPLAHLTTVPGSEMTQLTVKGMTCGKCTKKITEALSDIDGIIELEVDIKGDTVTIEHETDTDLDKVKSAIEDEGYTIE